MFDDIKASRSPFPFVTLIFSLCFTLITLGTIFIGNLKNVMGCYSDECSLIQTLTISFQHGFDEISSLIHLIVDLVLMIFLGIFAEKVMGSYRFFLLTLSSMLVYSLTHYFFKMQGHGTSAVIYSYVPIVFYCLNEGRKIKTRSAYDDHYSELKNILLVTVTILPVLFSFVPINFDSKLNPYQSIVYGNLFNLLGLGMGILFLTIFKKAIRDRLKTVSRKKKFDKDIFEKETKYACAVFPGILLLAFFLN